jgi:F0F1-type ATP synthase delta subunit
MENRGLTHYDIFKTVRTLEERVRFLNAIDALLMHLYENRPLDTKTVTDSFGPATSALLLQCLHLQNIELTDTGKMKEFLNELKEYAEGAEILRATLAVAADDGVKDVLGSWLQATFPDKPVIMEVTLDPSIVAGLQVAYKGRYWDFSLEKQVTQIFEEKKDQLFKTA